MHPDVHRHHMKESYQRNMILAQACIVGLIGIGLLATYFALSTSGNARHLRRVIESSIVIRDTTLVQRDSTRNARRWLPMLNPYAQRHEGFLGFITLRPSPVEPGPVEEPNLLAVQAPEYTPDDSLVSYSLLAGSDTGVFVPEDVDLLPYLPPDSERQLINRPVRLIYSVKPDVPPIAEWNNKMGLVEVLLLIDSLGNPEYFTCRQKSDRVVVGPVFELEAVLKNNDHAVLEFYVDKNQNDLLYVQLDEQPKAYHFGEYLLEVLPQWKFAPAIHDGHPVRCFVVVQYRYCRSNDPDCKDLLVRSMSS